MSCCSVLIAEDEPGIINLYREIFQPRQAADSTLGALAQAWGVEEEVKIPAAAEVSFEPTICTQGEDAVAAARRARDADTPFRVAILDVRMPPGIDGFETARRLREIDPDVYIIIATAFSDYSADEIQAVLKHDVVFLRKPFGRDEVVQMTRNFCNSWERDRMLQKALAQAEHGRSEAERLARLKREFMQVMRHELRTPLNVILGFARLLTSADLPDLVKEEARMIEDAGQKLFTKFEDIVLFSELFAGDVKNRPQLVPTVDLASKGGNTGQTLCFEPGHRVEVVTNPGVPEVVELDQRLWQVVMRHLLDNALKHSGSGTVWLKIETAPDEPGCMAFAVEDDGPGIDDAHLKDAFDLFTKLETEGVATKSGLGIGLPLAQRCAEAMGGELQVSRRPGGGSRFALVVPIGEPLL